MTCPGFFGALSDRCGEEKLALGGSDGYLLDLEMGLMVEAQHLISVQKAQHGVVLTSQSIAVQKLTESAMSMTGWVIAGTLRGLT